MTRLHALALTLGTSLLTAAAGCGGDDAASVDAGDETPCGRLVIPGGDGTNPGFIKPRLDGDDEDTRPGDGECILVQAWSESGDVFTEQTPDLSCLNTASTDTPTTVEVTLTSRVADFQSGDDVPDATVTVFDGVDINGTPVETATSGAGGAITFTIPAGRERFGFKRVADDYLDTLLLNQYLQPTNPTQSISVIQQVSNGTAAALPGLVGITRTPGKGILAGTIRDCAGNELSGVIATVSTTSGTVSHVGGTRTYYFSQSGLPVRNTVEIATTENGLFAALEIDPTATAYVQMWGVLSQADLEAGTVTLIGELEVPVVGDVVITGSYEPLRN
ncbi:MAG: hypothetical protein R2939_06315 [Kofleriaceae bacterium]